MKWIPKNYKQRQWHKWFAWYPVKITPDKVVWLEIVFRVKGHGYFGDSWSYMLEEKK